MRRRGDWPVGAINDCFRHWLKYSSSNWTFLSSQQTVLQTYTGPAAAGQINGKPALVGYESNIFNVDPADKGPLNHDCFYHSSYGPLWDAACQSWQDGDPRSSAPIGSGLDFAIISTIGGEWVNTQLFSQVIWGGQQAGDGTGNLFSTAQGGSPADGKAHDVSNSSPALQTMQAWWAKPSPPPTSSPAMRVSPSRIPPNQSNPITLRLAGIGTSWNSLSTVTVTNSLTGTTTVTAGTWTAISNTLATLQVTTGAGTGAWKLTIDGLDSPTLGVGSRRKGWFGRMRAGRGSPR